jgi:hypothetical protein
MTEEKTKKIYLSIDKNILELPGKYQRLVEEGQNIQN